MSSNFSYSGSVLATYRFWTRILPLREPLCNLARSIEPYSYNSFTTTEILAKLAFRQCATICAWVTVCVVETRLWSMLGQCRWTGQKADEASRESNASRAIGLAMN